MTDRHYFDPHPSENVSPEFRAAIEEAKHAEPVWPQVLAEYEEAKGRVVVRDPKTGRTVTWFVRRGDLTRDEVQRSTDD